MVRVAGIVMVVAAVARIGHVLGHGPEGRDGLVIALKGLELLLAGLLVNLAGKGLRLLQDIRDRVCGKDEG